MTTREEALIALGRSLVMSPFGTFDVPVQELKLLIAAAGRASSSHLHMDELKVLEKWRAILRQVGA